MVGSRLINEGRPASTVIVELAGVAGSGKSTLTRALVEDEPDWAVADSLHTRSPAHWPYVAHALPRVLPLAVGAAAARPWLSWDELKFMIYVGEWDRFLRAAPTDRRQVSVLDQGPIFALARLLWSEKPFTRTPAFRRWLDEILERWSSELDALVWLYAPEQILVQRINARTQPHDAKGVSGVDAVAVLRAHRRAYEQVLGSIAALGRPEVLTFDTSTSSPSEIARHVVAFVAARASREESDAARRAQANAAVEWPAAGVRR